MSVTHLRVSAGHLVRPHLKPSLRGLTKWENPSTAARRARASPLLTCDLNFLSCAPDCAPQEAPSGGHQSEPPSAPLLEALSGQCWDAAAVASAIKSIPPNWAL